MGLYVVFIKRAYLGYERKQMIKAKDLENPDLSHFVGCRRLLATVL